jgi:hypothetical protein
MTLLKTLLKQKTTWAGLAIIITGIGGLVTGEDKMVAINSILTGIAVIAGRQAIQKLA